MIKQAHTELAYHHASLQGASPHDAPSVKFSAESDSTPILPRRLRREIIFLLLIKAALLTLLYFLFFGPSQRAPQTPEAVNAHIFSAAVQPASPR